MAGTADSESVTNGEESNKSRDKSASARQNQPAHPEQRVGDATRRGILPAMWKIAWCNLVRDKLRFTIAVVGLVFSVVLMAVQVAIFLGAIDSSARLVDRCSADLWVVPQNASNADFSTSMPGRRRYQVLGVDGVKATGRMVVGFGNWRFDDGRQETVIVVGVDTERDWLPIDTGPIRGRTNEGYGVVMDEREKWRFGVGGNPLPIGTRGEIRGYRVHAAGYVSGMNSFAITPYAFCSYESALDLARIGADQTVFIMVDCVDGADLEAVRAGILSRIDDVEVLTRDEFAGRSWRYWVFGTGMGYSLVLMAVLALIVGMVVIGQTFVTSVLVKMREYGVLKAIGYDNGFVAGVIVGQGLIISLLGYVFGCAVAMIVSEIWGHGGTAVVMHMTPRMLLLLLPMTLVICLTSSLIGAWRVFRLAPAEVFR